MPLKSHLPGYPELDAAIEAHADAATNLAIEWLTIASKAPSEIVASAATIVVATTLAPLPSAERELWIDVYVEQIRRAVAVMHLAAPPRGE